MFCLRSTRLAMFLVLFGSVAIVSDAAAQLIKVKKPKIVEKVQKEADKKAKQVEAAAREKAKKLEEAAREKAKRAEKAAREKAKRLEKAAREEAKRLERKAREEAARLEEEAREEAARLKEEALEEAARLEEEIREEAARREEELRRAVEEVPDVTEVATKAAHSFSVEWDRTTDFAQSRAESLRAAVSAEANTALNVRNWERWIEEPDAVILSCLARSENSVHVEIGAGVDYLKNQWWYGKLQAHLLSLLIEPPTFDVCRDDLPGPAVWYVNGILTTREKAVKAGNAIAEKLGRRVHVLHNRTIAESPYDTGLEARGFEADDLSECLYDRCWPVIVVSRLDSIVESAIGAVMNSGEKLQGNPTTRQLAHVLYYSDEPVSLVTHSQGCLIARNAFFTMSLLSKEDVPRDKVAWVAAGLPLNDNEIWPRPEKTTILDYQDDPVSKLVGSRGGGFDYNAADHDFMEEYVEQLKPDQFWQSEASEAPE